MCLCGKQSKKTVYVRYKPNVLVHSSGDTHTYTYTHMHRMSLRCLWVSDISYPSEMLRLYEICGHHRIRWNTTPQFVPKMHPGSKSGFSERWSNNNMDWCAGSCEQVDGISGYWNASVVKTFGRQCNVCLVRLFHKSQSSSTAGWMDA